MTTPTYPFWRSGHISTRTLFSAVSKEMREEVARLHIEPLFV